MRKPATHTRIEQPRPVGGYVIGVLMLLFTSWASAAPTHHCAEAAKVQAKKLLVFHFGPDDRMAIADTVKTLPAIKNPAQQQQFFDVLEVWGIIYKGQYRMRLLYAQIPGECVLMGQEILEYAAL